MFYEIDRDGYLSTCGNMSGIFRELTEEEYAQLQQILTNKPEAPEGYGYRLTDEWEWELYEIPEEPEVVSDEDALNIMLGGEE